MRQYRAYTNQQVIDYSKEVTSLSQLLKRLNLRCAGGNFANMRRILQQLNINTDHWTGKAWNKNKQLKNWQNYTRNHSIKKHLTKHHGNKCNCCELEIWLDQPIKLELHHKDGDRTNNTINNLELLCPNCHSFTDTWRKCNHA